jgi:hypothetical protein
LRDRLIVRIEDYSLNDKGSSVLEHPLIVLEQPILRPSGKKMPRFS